MTPFQQLYLGLGAKKKTYIDDVFNTYIWKGTGSDQTINTGLDMAGEGGMVWVKNRSASKNHAIVDTVRGAGYFVESNTSDAQDNYPITGANPRNLNSFTSTGFTLKSDDGNQFFNWPTGDPKYASWSFRKAKGFFDIVTYTGNGSARTIAHSLGSVPGCVMIKCTSTAKDWCVWHRGATDTGTPGNVLYLNLSDDAEDTGSIFNDTAPTASVFTVETGGKVNQNGETYVAYLFAGGESTAATASSTEFTGSIYLTVPDASGDLDFQGGDRTIEMWIKPDSWGSGDKYLWSSGSQSLSIFKESGGGFKIGKGTSNWYTHPDLPPVGQWTHIALVRASDKMYLYYNGTLVKGNISVSSMYGGTRYVGTNYNSTSEGFDGKISNLRFTKSAVYTSSFKPPTEPLTNISNTELLMCNSSSSATASTVTTGTITSSGGVNPRSDSPFDDPAAFTFGNSEEGIIKCGSFVGNHTDKPEINLGWEPQYLLWKNADQSQDWFIVDSMRGAVSGGNDARLRPNNTDAENTGQDPIELTPTGFKCANTDFNINGNGDTTIYIAIRRPDGYVGKPVDAGTDVFAMDTGNSQNPCFDSGFPVDLGLSREFAGGSSWSTNTRLTGPKIMYTHNYNAEGTNNDAKFDHNTGYYQNRASNFQAWMWRRHAGFDVVTTGPGTGSGMVVRHSLGRNPEMIWAKKRATSNWGDNSSNNYVLDNWWVWHNNAGNSDAYKQAGFLNKTDARGQYAMLNSNNAVFATHVEFASNVTYSGDENLMLFFASINGISKCGSYSGSGSSGNAQNIGFQPRFLMVKRVDDTGAWLVYDSLRSNFDRQLELNTSNTQDTVDKVTVSSTGWSFTDSNINESGSTYIYYAHA